MVLFGDWVDLSLSGIERGGGCGGLVREGGSSAKETLQILDLQRLASLQIFGGRKCKMGFKTINFLLHKILISYSTHRKRVNSISMHGTSRNEW